MSPTETRRRGTEQSTVPYFRVSIAYPQAPEIELRAVGGSLTIAFGTDKRPLGA